MNQAKLCGLIVLLCVICPVMVGYAWPVNAEDETIYNVQNTTNITRDFTNGKVNTYAEYTDVYANNFNMFARDIPTTEIVPYYMTAYSNKTSLTEGSLYLKTLVRAYDSETYDSDLGHVFNLREIINSAPEGEPGSRLFGCIISGYNLNIDSTLSKAIIYYSNTDAFQYITNSDVMIGTNTDVAYAGYISVKVQYLYAMSYFTDLSGGFRLYTLTPSVATVNTWYNGYSNQRVDILLKTDYDMDLKIDIPRVASLVYNVYISEDGQIKFRAPGMAAKALGSVDTYPYVLLRIDAYNQKISLSGLSGMKAFTDPYESLMRHTIDVDLSLRSITHLNFTNLNGYVPIDYFIPKTISSITSVDGINAAEQNLRGYTGDDFQIQFKMPQFVSSGNGAIDFGPIEGVVNDTDKTITWTVGTKTLTAPIKDTYLLSIGRDLYVNGEMMYSYPSYQSEILLKFYGQWLMQLYYSDLDADTKPSYTWLPGGFGLNEVGFCVVGLMTAAGSGTAAMLAGRRSGTKAGLAMLVAGCCGAFYIMEIMNFM